MNNLWLKLRFWTKIIVFAILLIYTAIFVYQNSNREAEVWVWGSAKQSVLMVMFVSFLVGVIGTILVRTMSRTIRQYQEIKRGKQQARVAELVEQKDKADRLRVKPAEEQ